MSATIESPPEKENPASGETSGTDEQNNILKTTTTQDSTVNQNPQTRNWKKVNAGRATAKLAKQFGISRYSLDRMVKVKSLCSEEEWSDLHNRIMSRELEGKELKRVENEILKRDGKCEVGKSAKKITALWKSILSEVRKIRDLTGLSLDPDTEEMFLRVSALLFLRRSDLIDGFDFSVAYEELYPCPDSDTEEDWK